jgi:hypothetical protein
MEFIKDEILIMYRVYGKVMEGKIPSTSFVFIVYKLNRGKSSLGCERA